MMTDVMSRVNSRNPRRRSVYWSISLSALRQTRQRLSLDFCQVVKWVMAAYPVAVPDILPGRFFLFANRSPFARAARMEAAASRQVDRAGCVAFQADAFTLRFRIGYGDGREQRFGVRMQRRLEQLIARDALHQLAPLHPGDDVG